MISTSFHAHNFSKHRWLGFSYNSPDWLRWASSLVRLLIVLPFVDVVIISPRVHTSELFIAHKERVAGY